mmetsp:Transcript_57793/g.102602  ORF Transcript_57793/g.102602 Transcript_57793/m.102602 type:complete len:674 (-) Transcript_57793:93-2114(-)|eukprot:CAMPEP_0197657372 /NCGR_PEP_ID=MMETSP1338-20131121/44581_1 /TAXON_ID=43686 ORGANISM="Pelagodinium beii, Strain RCC1491" /NCGR_SAMPLE_ID=MMETSP1338 /ASSEMBLY_ACC=CAM_ASM_000754 /LENGTH=673 /DNA_ID=CAMNT_0043233719 /DNA_START=71 /DNA_END=2092 /DNA_ORIENTATION=-
MKRPRWRNVAVIFTCLMQDIFAAKVKLFKSAAESAAQDNILSLLGSQDTVGRSKPETSAMEDVILNLAQEAKAQRQKPGVANDSGNISDFVTDLSSTIDGMLQDLLAAAVAANDTCTAGFQNLTSCPEAQAHTVYYPPGFDGDFTPLRNAHTSCRQEIASVHQEAQDCERIRSSAINTEQQALLTFNQLNKFESPTECIANTGNQELYLKTMRDQFRAKRIAWWDAYWALGNASARVTQWACSEKTLAYFNKLAECNQAQLNLETMACDVHAHIAEGCNTTATCHDNAWNNYVAAVTSAKTTIEDLKYQYRALKRMQCLIEAFKAADMDAAIDACISQIHSTAPVESSCVSAFTGQKPNWIVPDVCTQGYSAILSPNDPNFNSTEYVPAGLQASPCYAACCKRDVYTWVLHAKTFASRSMYVSEEHFFYDMDRAKTVCESLTSTQCMGVYDKWCDGIGDEDPLYLVSGSVTPSDLSASGTGSCVVEMVLGGATTTTTTLPAHNCTWQVNVSRSQNPTEVWKTWTVHNQGFDDIFQFTTCSTEGKDGTDCQATTPNGVRVMTNRAGQGLHTGVCCNQFTNAVIGSQKLSCDGFLNKYQQRPSTYVATTKLLSESVVSRADAESRCLQLGSLCWGLLDDSCDNENFRMVAGQLLDEDNDLLASQVSCTYKKLPVT